MKNIFDWKVCIHRYPYIAVSAAVGAGFLIASTLTRRKPTPMERMVNVLLDKTGELGDDLRRSACKLVLKTVAPVLFRGAIYGLAGKTLMQYLQSKAILAKGNGANLSSGMEWKRSQQPVSTPPIYS